MIPRSRIPYTIERWKHRLLSPTENYSPCPQKFDLRFKSRFRPSVRLRKKTANAQINICQDIDIEDELSEEELAYLFPDEEFIPYDIKPDVLMLAASTVPINRLPVDAAIAGDPYDEYYRTLPAGQAPDRSKLVVAKESYALRAVVPVINNHLKVESILDPGCQIIAMSEDVCHELALAYDPSIVLHMESANGSVDPSLGLARNVPFLVGSITVYLQVHVIRSPAYDILLGRPFDVLTESIVRNFKNEDQTITLHDPNSGQVATIPTISRGPPRILGKKKQVKSQDTFSCLDPVSPSRSPTSVSLYAYGPLPTPLDSVSSLSYSNISQSDFSSYLWFPPQTPLSVLAAKKKYKPVALKIQPIMTELPERFRITRNILGDPLDTLPTLPKPPEPFRPHGRYTLERKEYIDNAHPSDFLWPIERALAESSRDFTMFQMPFGALRLTTLPMGWTNSVPIFHADVTHILRPEMPHLTVPYIDDVPVKGPHSYYQDYNRAYETIENT
jgi:hypothetical protein